MMKKQLKSTNSISFTLLWSAITFTNISNCNCTLLKVFFCIWHGIPMLSIATISKSEEFVRKICIFVHLADLQGGIECNAHTCSSPRPVCIVRQQRAHIWHSEMPRCISQSGELQWRSKGRWASMLHKHPFLSLMTYSPHLHTSHLLCLYISLTVCPVNTLSFVHLSLLKGGIWLVNVKTLKRG